jgi:hypothetical protein
MAIFNLSNQLIQINTGQVRTSLFNPTTSPISIYANIGMTQVLGQRYASISNATAVNPFGAPTIYELVQYLSTSALTTANLTTFGGPVPVWWTDTTFTTVTAISTEALSLNLPAGYLMTNIISLTTLTAAQLLGAQVFIAVSGYVKGCYAPTAGTAGVGNFIVPVAGTGTSSGVVAGTAPSYNKFGTQLTAIASGLCDVLVDADII